MTSMLIAWMFEGTFNQEMLKFLIENPAIKAYGQRGTDLKWRSYVEASEALVEQMKAMTERIDATNRSEM